MAEDIESVIVFLSVVDRFIVELETRFPQDFCTILPLEGLIPAYCLKYSEDKVLQTSEKYEKFLEISSLIRKAELTLRKKKWVDESERRETAIEALKNCDKQFL